VAESKKNILIVEDDDSVALMEKSWLCDAGYGVLYVSTGEQAVEIVNRGGVSIDLILMDIDLGAGIDGAETAGKILDNHDLPILFLSSHNEDAIVKKAASVPSYGYVYKDNKGTILLASIEMAFRLFESHKLLLANRKLLKEKEIWFDETQKVASIGSYKLDFNTGIWEGTKELKEIFGIDDNFVCNIQGWLDVVHPNDRGMMENYLKDIVVSRTFFKKQYRIKKISTGEERWVYGLGDVSYDTDGNPVTMFGTIQDITDSKIAEEHIRISNERLDLAAKAAKLGVWGYDVEYGHLFWDDFMYVLYGVNKKDFYCNEQTWLELIHPDDREKVKTDMLNLINSGSEFTSTFRIIIPAGQTKYIKADGSAVRNADGKLIKVLGVNYDITEMKTAEKTIGAKDELIKMTGQLTKTGGWEYEVDSGNMIWTDEVLAIYNIESKNIPDLESALSYYLEESRSILKDAFKNAIENKISYDLVLRFLDGSGKRKWVRSTATPVLEHGRVVKLRGIFQDITEQKEIEDRLYENENIFNAFMEYSPIYIFVKDNYAKPVRLSKNFNEMLGRPIDEIIGRPMTDLFPPGMAEKMIQDDLSVLRANKFVKVVEELGGRYFETTKFPITIKGKPKYLAGYTMDITERLEDEQKLKMAADKLRESNSTKDRLFSIIAHDLKGPFSGFIGLSEALATNLSTLTKEEISTYAAIMHSTAKRIYELLNSLLEWSRIQSDKLEFNPIEINLHALVENIKNLFSVVTEKKDITIINKIDLGISVLADSNMAASIFRNLISNAIKFSNPGGNIIVGGEVTGRLASISVTDKGVGMSKELIDRLFRIEKGISTKGTANEEGSGLGLVLCKEMLEKNGGEIKVKSSINEGTTFIFTLPLA
jgi:PAS domain S-box-containing protein